MEDKREEKEKVDAEARAFEVKWNNEELRFNEYKKSLKGGNEI